MQVYYVYEKSPKKCRELVEVVNELKACLDQSEMPQQGGSRPLCACGTRFVAHKAAALGRLIEHFGAYIAHLIALSEDSAVRSVDRQKLKGYILKWHNSKVILACAFFHDLLHPVASLSKVLQEDELCVVRAIEVIMKTKKALERVKSSPFEDLPTVKKVLARVKEEDGLVTYQGQDIIKHEEGLKAHYTQWVDSVESCRSKDWKKRYIRERKPRFYTRLQVPEEQRSPCDVT